jgi:hypothetical protein
MSKQHFKTDDIPVSATDSPECIWNRPAQHAQEAIRDLFINPPCRSFDAIFCASGTHVLNVRCAKYARPYVPWDWRGPEASRKSHQLRRHGGFSKGLSTS